MKKKTLVLRRAQGKKIVVIFPCGTEAEITYVANAQKRAAVSIVGDANLLIQVGAERHTRNAVLYLTESDQLKLVAHGVEAIVKVPHVASTAQFQFNAVPSVKFLRGEVAEREKAIAAQEAG